MRRLLPQLICPRQPSASRSGVVYRYCLDDPKVKRSVANYLLQRRAYLGMSVAFAGLGRRYLLQSAEPADG